MYTLTQQRIMCVLSDRQSHPAADLQLCLYDELGDVHNIYFHLNALRKILRESKQAIITERGGPELCFRLADFSTNDKSS
jgi:hypothetical protein